MRTKLKDKIWTPIWVPLIWYAIAASRGVALWINPEFSLSQDMYLSGNPIDRTIDALLIFAGVLILCRRRIDWSSIRKKNIWIFLLFLYMGYSVLWSDFMFVSAKRWIKTTGTLVMVLVVVTEPDPLEAISTVLRRCFYLHIFLSVIFIKYIRNLGVMYSDDGTAEMWLGVTTHKNVLGQVVMISAVYFLWSLVKTWGEMRGKRADGEKWGLWYPVRIGTDVFYLAMVFWLLKGSPTTSSKSSVFVMLYGISIFLGLHLMRKNPMKIRKNVAVSIFSIMVIVLTLQIAAETYSQNSLLSLTVESSGRDMTFTGRTDLWVDMLDIASENPIFGVGYGSFWIGDLGNDLWDKYDWFPGQGHNGYIDIYVELGIVGLFLLSGSILFIYRNIFANIVENFEYGRLQMVYISMILLHNVTETSFLRGKHNLWFIFLLFALSTPGIRKYTESKSGR